MENKIRVWNTKTKTYENRKVKLKGAIITGQILEVMEIILILVIIMGLLSICGFSILDLIDVMGTGLTDLWEWAVESILGF